MKDSLSEEYLLNNQINGTKMNNEKIGEKMTYLERFKKYYAQTKYIKLHEEGKRIQREQNTTVRKLMVMRTTISNLHKEVENVAILDEEYNKYRGDLITLYNLCHRAIEECWDIPKYN